MATKDQIKNEFFLSLLKRLHDPVVNDIVVAKLVRSSLNKKYQYYLAEDEFYKIGDELAEAGLFRWNDDGRLALTNNGLTYLKQFR